MAYVATSVRFHESSIISGRTQSPVYLEDESSDNAVSEEYESQDDCDNMVIQPLNSKMRSTMAAHELGTIIDSLKNGSLQEVNEDNDEIEEELSYSQPRYVIPAHNEYQGQYRFQEPNQAPQHRSMSPRRQETIRYTPSPHASNQNTMTTISPGYLAGDDSFYTTNKPRMNYDKQVKASKSKNNRRTFVKQRDFDRTPGSLDMLSPPLEKLPPERPGETINVRNLPRDAPLPSIKTSTSKQLVTKSSTPRKTWNSLTKKTDAWKPLENYSVIHQDNKKEEFRNFEKFISPKDWRLLNSKKKGKRHLAIKDAPKHTDHDTPSETPQPRNNTFLTQGNEEEVESKGVRKGKFDPSSHVRKKKERLEKMALLRAEQAQAGNGIVVPFKERVKELGEVKVKHHKSEKPKWDTAAVGRTLTQLLKTEDMKLKAYERQLHISSKELSRTHAAPHTLDPLRKNISKIRFRLADLREAQMHIKKENWQKDMGHLLISSNVPLDTFLDDCTKLQKDCKYFVDDTPW
eukprot:m.116270 g.116270  ORF g.116270 m.116270 type:complete len:517 (+) comp14227_c1_seq4:263-1813(+)